MGAVLPYSCSNWTIVQGDNQENLVVKDKETGQVYGAAGAGKYPTLLIRGRFTVSFFTQFAVGILFRLPFKIIHFLSGDFISRGAEIGTREWEHIRFTNHQNKIHDEPYLAPRIARSILTELVKDIIKIVTYPLALIVMPFITLIGIFDPLDGRKWYAYIEDLYAMGEEECCECPFITNFHMPCNQPEEVWERRNLFVGTPHYDPESPQSQLLSIKKLIQKDALYFGDTKPFLDLLNEAKTKPGYKSYCHHLTDPRAKDTLLIAKKLIVDFINDPYLTTPELVFKKFKYIIQTQDLEFNQIYWKILEIEDLIQKNHQYFESEKSINIVECLLNNLKPFKEKIPLDDIDLKRLEAANNVIKDQINNQRYTLTTMVVHFQNELHKY